MALRSLLSKQRFLSSLLSASSSPLRSISTAAYAALRRAPLSLPPRARPRGFSLASGPAPGREAQNLDPEVLLPGCDFKHWLVFVDPPKENTSRADIIDSYVKMLAQAVGSEEEAKTMIYSVSTRYYFAFGAVIPREVCDKLKEMQGVQWVLPDSYLDPKTKDYGGEPFINGEAVPYDPKYHEVWLRNRQNQRQNERRKFDRPRGSWQNSEYQRGPRPQQPFQSRDFQNQNQNPSAAPAPNQYTNPDRNFQNPAAPSMPNQSRSRGRESESD